MSHNKVNKAQNRGKRRRYTPANIDNMSQRINVLIAEMGIGTEPEPAYDEESKNGPGIEFGLTEVLGGFFLIATAAVCNWHFG